MGGKPPDLKALYMSGKLCAVDEKLFRDMVNGSFASINGDCTIQPRHDGDTTLRALTRYQTSTSSAWLRSTTD